ncbi:AAA family ATPase [Kribbella sp. NPDC056951]|uniref:AAA family ATPase n=1 Tax=Kribbella sp. NPDC056951 TaxID=3345978 RepID=UPI003641943C
MSQVFGTPRLPAHAVARTDRLGRAVTLAPVLPERRAILFTGPPGAGKTRELDHAAELAERHGWTAIRVEASAREPLEHRFTRAIGADLGKLRREFGGFRVRKLRRAVRDLTQRQRKVQHGAEVRIGGGPVQFVTKKQWDATPLDNLGTTLHDVADRLGELSPDRPVLLMVDNVDAASPYDLAGLSELAEHLQNSGRPVWLVAAGGTMTTSRLLAASQRMPFELRELAPLSDPELTSLLTVPLDRAGIPYEQAGVSSLVRSANGDPGRLRTLADTALSPDGITAGGAAAAIERVHSRSAVLYQARWDKSTNPQKAVLAAVAAGVPLADIPGQWQQLDEARQELVARGLIRETTDQPTVTDPGMHSWLNKTLAQPAPQIPSLASTSSLEASAAGPGWTAGRVLGTTRAPSYTVDRKDGEGRAISLDQRVPGGTTVLFTGEPGMGKSRELDRAQGLAAREGWIAVRVEASSREPLENRLIRAISQDLDTVREHFGAGAARTLKKDLDQLAGRTRRPQAGNEVRVGVPGAFQVVAKEQHESEEPDEVGSTLNELADRLGAISAAKGEPLLLMVDNLDNASDRDLVALTELSARLEQNRQPVFLIAAGSNQTTSRLLEASGGQAGIETDVVTRFDLRKLEPFTDAELRPALAEPLRQAAVPHTPEAVDHLVQAANGNPARLRALATTALDLADPTTGLTTPVAHQATTRHNESSRPLYEAAWHNCTPAEKSLLAQAAQTTTGIPLPPATTSRWPVESAATRPLTQGLLRATPTHLTLADPGLRTYLQTRLTHATPQPTNHPTPTTNGRPTPKTPDRSTHLTR